jgi:hypothetical protein
VHHAWTQTHASCQTECQNLWQVEHSKKVVFYSSSVGYGMLSHGSVWKWAPHTDVAPALGALEHKFYDFPYIGNVIIPSDELIFFKGVGSTTNQ